MTYTPFDIIKSSPKRKKRTTELVDRGGAGFYWFVLVGGLALLAYGVLGLFWKGF